MKSSYLKNILVFGTLLTAGALVGWLGGTQNDNSNRVISTGLLSTAQASSDETPQVKPRKLEKIDKTNRVVEVVEAVSPSIVTVGAVKKTMVAQPWLHNFFMTPQYRISERMERLPYMGSGFIADDQGRVITNYHVIEDSESYFVTTSDGREFAATLVDADRYTDIAVLQIDAPNQSDFPPPLQLADSKTLRIGEQVAAFGNPFGNLIDDSEPTVTVGYISALNRTFAPDQQNKRVYQDMIQTDSAINPGNSGGPLVDLNGEVVGVNTFIFSPSGGSTGIGFAIPAHRVKNIVDEITEYGRLRPLLLDFAFRTVRTRSGQAVQILGMEPQGPAEVAGLQPGDLLISVDDQRVTSRDEFLVLFGSKQVGDLVELEVVRQGGSPFKTKYEIQEAVKEISE